jgi:peptidoglycan/xylan/chitin deacetylase (PgdA/CDA1 family)
MRRPGGVPVLVYHSVSPDQGWLPWSDRIAVTPETFDRHLTLLRRRGFTVLGNRVFLDHRAAGLPMPPRPAVIHLDDGYLDNWVAAVPILRRHGLPATIMVSLDFIEPGDLLRPTLDDVAAGRAAPGDLDWQGYVNRAEIAAIERGGLVAIEAHGTDHGRVETGPAVVDVLAPDNWRRLAWVQWRAMAGDKSGWFRTAEPPRVPLGTPVRCNAPALAARAWRDAGTETAAAWLDRVGAVLAASRDRLGAVLGRPVTLFCWPENAVTPEVHALALSLGYRATTGGRGENRPGEDPTVISRVHAGDRALGLRWDALDDLHLLASCRAFHGNYYWCLPLFAIHALAAALAVLRRAGQGARTGTGTGAAAPAGAWREAGP